MVERLSCDVAIVGGGTAGCAAALALRKRGLSAVLLERRLVGSQASGVNFGGVRQQGRDLAELPLSMRGRPLWDRLPELVGDDCEFAATGHLKLAHSEEEMAELERFAHAAAAFGLEIEVFGANALRERFPLLGPTVVGATLCRSDGQANPRLVAPAFARAARRAGADIREHCEVVGLAWDGSRFRLETASGPRVDAGYLINVAGAWGSWVAEAFGESVPLEMLYPNMLVTEPVPHVLGQSIGVVGGGLYARQVDRGNLVFGGGQGIGDRHRLWSRPRGEASFAGMQHLARSLPAFAEAQVIRSWTGIEGSFADGIPVIGPSRTAPNLVHAFGFCGHGFQLGPVIGEILAELLVEGETLSPIEPFAIDRFPLVSSSSSDDIASRAAAKEPS